MLVMRFQRVGRRNDPAYRVVVVERRSKPQSGGKETVGSYHPKTKHLVLQKERILYWLAKGVKASPTVHNLLIKNKIVEGKKIPVVKAAQTSIATATITVEKPAGGMEKEQEAVSSQAPAA